MRGSDYGSQNTAVCYKLLRPLFIFDTISEEQSRRLDDDLFNGNISREELDL
jgi:hypothetical protein